MRYNKFVHILCLKICSHDMSQNMPFYSLFSTNSENAGFAKKLEDNGVKFVGPTVDNL